ncbi:hypothetical protein HPB50_009704 [Hyalomma asiaticum]|uniref:Uncharacterized protein n=1 Tax=Hyalomma asiaticum TaxID=266040 RepID=A0ACB7TEY0_HYAAI|nr:hypothetical protein HPB50_009704 [Hyalomma asiaticum]
MAVLSNETPWFMHLVTPSGAASDVLPDVPDIFLIEAMIPKNVDIVVRPWTKVEGLARGSYTGHGRRLFPIAGGDLLVFKSVKETLSQCTTRQVCSGMLGGQHQTAVSSSRCTQGENELRPDNSVSETGFEDVLHCKEASANMGAGHGEGGSTGARRLSETPTSVRPDATDASALAILEKIAANGDNSDLDLSDSEDPPDGEEANEQCDEIRDEVEEEDCQYDSDKDVGDGDDGVSNPATPRCERWPRKQAYKSVLPDLPDAPASSADERDGWYAIVLKLAVTLPRGSSLYFDRYFTGVRLLESLAEMNLRGTGTVMKSRLPKGLKLKDDRQLREEGRGAMSQCVGTVSNICVTNWYNNKPILLASTHVGMEPVDECKRFSKKERKKVPVKRPAVVAEYNAHMGGVDLCDRMLSYYPTTMRTKKWTIRTLVFMMDVGVLPPMLSSVRENTGVRDSSYINLDMEHEWEMSAPDIVYPRLLKLSEKSVRCGRDSEDTTG